MSLSKKDQHFYQGQLLLANPTNPADNLSQAAILVTHCNESESAVRAVQINNVIPQIDLDEVSRDMGIPLYSGKPVYNGGVLEVNKIHIIHSLDWQSPTTKIINKDLAITIDVSVLAAISKGQGPRKFKACSGHWFWSLDLLKSQLQGPMVATTDNLNEDSYNRSRYRWEIVPASLDLIFNSPDSTIWRRGLDLAARLQTAQWFGNNIV